MTRVCEYAAARGLRGFTDIRAAGNSGILGNRNDVFTLSGEYARIVATTLPTQFKNKNKKKRILYLKINVSFARSSHEVKPHSHSFRFIRRGLKQRTGNTTHQCIVFVTLHANQVYITYGHIG